ncbi:MAG TPA: type VI secretion system-associated FHA domain protein TagH [Rhodanobacter sp.]
MPTPQTLTLAVLGHQAAQFGSRSQRAFSGKDGSIGRSEDCDWVLSASGVSRVHAMVRYLNGLYFIEDRSTNGMLLNGAPLIRGAPTPLKDGDRLQIDAFEVSVRMEQDSETVVQVVPRTQSPSPAPMIEPRLTASEPLDFAMFDLAPPVASGSNFNAGTNAVPGGSLIPDAQGIGTGSELDPLSFLDEPLGAPLSVSDSLLDPPAQDWNHTPGTADHFRPPTTVGQRQANALPENWDLTMGDFSPKPPPVEPASPAPAPPATPPSRPTAAENAAPIGTLPPELEQIFHIVVEGMMDVLRARAEIKNTFRLPVTIIQRSENNPLKFAATPDEAMQKIMAAPNAAFLSGTAAFDDAFDDIRCHQMAMLAGVRAAFESLLAHFNPDRFEHEADGGAKRSAFGGKGRYWEKYRENFEGLMKNPDECFRRLFGDEFARAYEEQLSRLKSARRAQKARQR